jgi:hypothetical protein
VPVVTVTSGPDVVKFPKDVLVVLSSAFTAALALVILLEAEAHFKPVASALSATNLIQEQSQRIVLGT